MGWLSWVGQTGETGLSPRPSQAMGHCPWKFWINAACVPVSESGDGCPREIIVTSSSGRPRPTRWWEWPGSRPPKGDATWRVITRSSAVSANRYPSVRIKSGHASKIENRSLTPFPDPVPVGNGLGSAVARIAIWQWRRFMNEAETSAEHINPALNDGLTLRLKRKS